MNRYSIKLLVTILNGLMLMIIFSSCNNRKQTLFSQVPASSSNIHFKNELPDRKLFNILYYLYYYNGGGVSVGDINNDSLPDIYFTANDKGKINYTSTKEIFNSKILLKQLVLQELQIGAAVLQWPM